MEYGEGGKKMVDLLVKLFTLHFPRLLFLRLVVTGKDFV